MTHSWIGCGQPSQQALHLGPFRPIPGCSDNRTSGSVTSSRHPLAIPPQVGRVGQRRWSICQVQIPSTAGRVTTTRARQRVSLRCVESWPLASRTTSGWLAPCGKPVSKSCNSKPKWTDWRNRLRGSAPSFRPTRTAPSTLTPPGGRCGWSPVPPFRLRICAPVKK